MTPRFSDFDAPISDQAPGVLDPFGRDAGWMDVPQEPAEAPSSLAEVSLEIPRGAAYASSPADWRDEVFYSVLIDRFSREQPFSTWGPSMDASTRHGGNIRGLTQRLNYLQGLGVTAILVNPIVMNPPAGYHQYWAIHFMAVDPQIGTMADFKDLVAQAHRRGMRVVLDMVFNHTGPILEYEGGFEFGKRKTIKRWRYPLKPVELAREEHFSRRGDISDWNDPEQIREGDLPGGINRLDTDNPATQRILIDVAKWWLRETDVDGYRLDVYKHVASSFWTRFFPEIRDYAGRLGKNNFLMLGEIYDGDPRQLVSELTKGRLDCAYNYPAYYWNEAALRGEAPTRTLEANHLILRSMLGEAHSQMANFIGNHDRPRFLRENDRPEAARFAIAHTMLSAGIPYLYYGDEQAFRRVAGRERLDLEASRDDMIPDGDFKNDEDALDTFDVTSPLYRLVHELAAARKAFPALRRGEQYVRWSDPNGAGIYAFSRVHDGQEVLVALNSAAESRRARMWVCKTSSPAGTYLIDALDPSCGVAVHAAQDGGSIVDVEVPAYGIRILSRGLPGARYA